MSTGIQWRKCSDFGQIWPFPTELGKCPWLNNFSQTYNGEMVSPSYLVHFLSELLSNLLVASTGIKSQTSIEFWPDRIGHFWVTCPWRRIKFSVDLWNLQIQLTFQMKIYWVNCGLNSSYSFAPIAVKLFRCFLHGKKICMWFWYNPLIIFSHFFCFMNFVFFRYEMLSKCIDSGYLVSASLTVFHWLFWNFADVFSMNWRCACGFGIILWLINFFSLFLLCELSLFIFFYMKCYQSV